MAAAHNHTARFAVLLLAVAMLTVTMPAIASHNSFGAHYWMTEADEVEAGGDVSTDQQGTIVPDIARDGPLDPDYHENLEADGLPSRDAPPDQSGLSYRATDCTPWDAYKQSNPGDPFSAYQDGLVEGEACYVGFLDHQIEYQLVSEGVIVTECPCDLLYPVNPQPSDEYCQGQEDTENRSAGGEQIPTLIGEDSVVDETITSLTRRDDSRCGTGQDNSFLPGGFYMDTDLLEAGVTEAHDSTGSAEGSGTWSLPYLSKPYVYLFGQPHPLTDEEDRTGITAGEGVFGPNPAAMGSPLADIDGACGGRTADCDLLSPQDILNYDDNFPTEADKARVCFFIPQYDFSVAGGDGTTRRGADTCGNTGNRADDFVGQPFYGGLGTDAAPTWMTNQPGWYWAVTYTPNMQNDGVIDLDSEEDDHPDGVVDDYFDDEKDTRAGFDTIVAVNPAVPTRQSSLRCLVPNILTGGDDGPLPDGFTDNGVYGTYVADAIDVDVHPVTARAGLLGVRDATHDPVRNGEGPVPGLAAVQDATGIDHPNDVLEADVDVGQTVEDTLPGEADYTEDGEPEPHAEYHGSDYETEDGIDFSLAADTTNQEPFINYREKGLTCNAAGELEFNANKVFQGAGMRLDVNLQQTTATLKDPTLGVQDEEESDAGAWQTDVYTFGGQANAVLDSNGNEEFDSCPGANLDPGEDVCPWEALWDAYNPSCTDNDNNPCGALLKQKGYNVSKGVGLVANLTVTGPLVVGPEATNTGLTLEEDKATANTHVLGTEETTVQNCVIGTSIDFAPHLAKLVGTETGGADTGFDAEDAAEFCPDQVGGGPGDWVLIEDAFDDQSAAAPGTFSADIEWYKLLPTPSTMQESNGFGADDELCLTGYWSVNDDKDGVVANETATGDENGIADDTEADPDSPGQENIVLTNGVHEFSDCDSFDTAGEPEE